MNKFQFRTAEGGGACRPVSAILMMSFIVLAIIGAFAFAGPDDCAEASDDSNETYNGTCGENLVWELDSTTGALKIIGHGPMTDYDFTVKALYPPWWTMKDNIRSIEFIDDEEGGITYIGNCALSYIQYLTDTRIVMPDSVTSTGIKVFFDTNLTEIVLSKNLTELNNHVLTVLNNRGSKDPRFFETAQMSRS